jgi:hypothetical protein
LQVLDEVQFPLSTYQVQVMKYSEFPRNTNAEENQSFYAVMKDLVTSLSLFNEITITNYG